MGFDVFLQNERGQVLETVSDPHNFLHRLFERSNDPLLAEIDWNGDTVFNRLQMPRFLSAWQSLAQESKSPGETEIVDEIMTLAKRCHSGVHLYIKFFGD